MSSPSIGGCHWIWFYNSIKELELDYTSSMKNNNRLPIQASRTRIEHAKSRRPKKTMD